MRVRLLRKGKVAVTLQIDPEVRPHADASATVASADFLGAKYVEYDPGVKDELFPVGQPIPGVVDAGIADAVVSWLAINKLRAISVPMNKMTKPQKMNRWCLLVRCCGPSSATFF